MSESTPKTTPQAKRQKKHIPCHIHDKCDDNYRESIHQYVCRDLETIKHTDGNHYCLLHLPTKEKLDAKGKSRVEEFEKLFKERLLSSELAIATIEANFPENKEKQADIIFESQITYDFRYVWFPSKIFLIGYVFKAPVYFSNAFF